MHAGRWLLRDGRPQRADPWRWLKPTADEDDRAALPDGPIIVPLALWRRRRNALIARAEVGVWLASDEFAEDMPEAADADPPAAFNRLALIALRFDSCVDGRGFSTARILRERYRYQGELRAAGDFLPDQLHYLRRCGCDAFELPESLAFADAERMLNAFSVHYQAAADSHRPRYRFGDADGAGAGPDD